MREEPVFYLDTITCPLYRFESSKDPGDFSAISGVYGSLDEATRYRDKFERYLVTIAHVSSYLANRGIVTKGRVYFGDAGVINALVLKEQFGVEKDEELRACLTQNAKAYESYLDSIRESLGIQNLEINFSSLSDEVPGLKVLPIDLYELVDEANIIPVVNDSVSVLRSLESHGVNSKVAREVIHVSEELIRKRLHSSMRNLSSAGKITIQAYKETIGFLLGYGYAGRELARRATSDMLVSLDPPGNYRNNLYYSYFSQKGEGLAVFTPSLIDSTMGDLMFRNGGQDDRK